MYGSIKLGTKIATDATSTAMLETPLIPTPPSIIIHGLGVSGLMCSDWISHSLGNLTVNAVDYFRGHETHETNTVVRPAELGQVGFREIHAFREFTVGLVDYMIQHVPYEQITIDPNRPLVLSNDQCTLTYHPQDVKFFHDLIRSNQQVNRIVGRLQDSVSSAVSNVSHAVNTIRTDSIRFNERTHQIQPI